ncbi:reticuline oxidase-like protein, putative [Medicago truncatula]|uniref:Reticuline oxidase-like protein, putative n=1 Tax=Medicago truncatula TaxID=3880 RepID=G7LEL9_MEDTR|nr:reticuline oxidase-like protein, putative [Medicago truncatula]
MEHYKIQYLSVWQDGDKNAARHIDWIRNPKNSTSYIEASVWGYRYFNGNFNKLVKIKTRVDPENVFRHEHIVFHHLP